MSGSTRNLRDGKVIIQDGSPSPKQLEIPIAEGDLAFTQKSPSFVVLNRGRIDSRKQGDETPLDVSFTGKFEQWSGNYGSTGLSPVDVMDGTQKAIDAGWISTDPCGPWAIDVLFQMQNPCNKAEFEQLTFRKVHFDEIAFKEGNEYNTFAPKGTALQPKVESTFVTP
jgi:hypothetical protein